MKQSYLFLFSICRALWTIAYLLLSTLEFLQNTTTWYYLWYFVLFLWSFLCPLDRYCNMKFHLMVSVCILSPLVVKCIFRVLIYDDMQNLVWWNLDSHVNYLFIQLDHGMCRCREMCCTCLLFFLVFSCKHTWMYLYIYWTWDICTWPTYWCTCKMKNLFGSGTCQDLQLFICRFTTVRSSYKIQFASAAWITSQT